MDYIGTGFIQSPVSCLTALLFKLNSFYLLVAIGTGFNHSPVAGLFFAGIIDGFHFDLK